MQDSYVIYCIALAACGTASALAAIWFYCLKEKSLFLWEKLPRNVLFGALFAIADLIWCVPHAVPVVPTGSQHLIVPGAIVSGILAIVFLDYLFSRAVGGFMILLAHYFLHESFTFHTPLSWLFALFCFAIGTVGIFFAGKPYLMRDLIRKAVKDKKVKYTATLFSALFAVFCLAVSIYHFVAGAHP